jgi:hypothetical protein
MTVLKFPIEVLICLKDFKIVVHLSWVMGIR